MECGNVNKESPGCMALYGLWRVGGKSIVYRVHGVIGSAGTYIQSRVQYSRALCECSASAVRA